jgi:hypothetical protein
MLAMQAVTKEHWKYIMRAREFISETTTSGSVAAVAMPIGGMQSRNNGSFFQGKYVTDSDPTPNTPKEYKRNKHARGRFKNTPGN